MSKLKVRRPFRDGGWGGRREARAQEPQPSPAARRAVHPLRRTDTSARWPRDLRPLCAGTVGMRRHGARAMSACRRAPMLYALAAEELERAGDDRAKAVTVLTHQLHADDSAAGAGRTDHSQPCRGLDRAHCAQSARSRLRSLA